MIELIAYEQKSTLATDVVGDQWTLDITQPGGVSLNYEVSKGEDIMGRYSPFSQTFKLPFTNHNSRFFGLYYDVNLTSASAQTVFNIHKKTYCEIRVDGIPIITGSLQLKNVHTKSEEYEVAVFGEEANIFQEIKDRKLIDLFIKSNAMDIDYDVPLTPINIYNSWNPGLDVTTGNVGNGIVIFPLADYGLGGEYNFLYYENNDFNVAGLATNNFIEPFMFKPSIQVAHLFEKIITQAGYTLTTNSFLTSDAWTKLYMTLATDRESTATRGVLGLCVANDGASGPLQLNQTSPPGQWVSTELPLNDDTGTGVSNDPPALFDASDNWDTTNLWFTAPATGWYHGTINIRYTANIIGNSGAQMQYGVLVPGVTSDFSYQYTCFNGTNVANTFNWSLFIEEGQKMRTTFRVRMNGSNAYQYVQILPSGTYLTIYASQLTNGIAQLPNNMPDLQQSAFVKDLCERFNLCVVADAEDSKALKIQPWQDYINDGARKDWTDRLDTSKEFTIKPTDSIRNKFIYLTDAEDDSINNAAFQESNNYVIGEYRQEVGDDFTSGTLSNNPVFAPFQVSIIPESNGTTPSPMSDVLIHRGYGIDTNGPISTAKPKLFYYNGLKDIANGNYIKIGNSGSEFTKYSLCLPFYNNGDPIQSDSPLALWKWQPTSVFGHPTFGSTPSGEGYFARYHQQFLMSIYGNEARIVECEIMLSPTDIFNFRFNDEIIIKNTAYRVLKISNYQPFANVPTKVTLLKKLDAFKGQSIPQPEQDCALIITGFQQNGNVIFTDPTDGTTSSGNEICCNENGYNWNTTQNACMWLAGPTGTGNGLNDGILPDTPYSDGKSLVTNIGGVYGYKNKQSKNFNPIVGEVSIQGNNELTGIPTTQKNVVLYATTYSNTIANASSTGKADTSGYLFLPSGMTARMVIRALSVQTDKYSATSGVGSQGSTSFKVWTFMAKNVAGTITVTGSEQTDFAQEDTDAGTRTVTVSPTKGTGSFTDQNLGVIIRVTGPASTVCTWNLDCSITFIDIASEEASSTDLLLLEDMGYILAEDYLPLEQE